MNRDVVTYGGILGGIAFALSGYFVGLRKELDLMGVFIVAFLTANGGGVLRDVLLGREPGVLKSVESFWLVGGVIAVAWLLRLHPHNNLERRWYFIVSDAVGLVAFAITGAVIGLAENLHFFGVLLTALLSAVGGGIIRDLLVNDVPEVLHGGFYGSVALIVGALPPTALHALNADSPAGLPPPLRRRPRPAANRLRPRLVPPPLA